MTTTPYAPPPPPAAPPAAPPPQKSSGCLKWGLIGCGVVIVLGAVVCAVIMIFVFGAMKRSDVYKGALNRVQNDPRAVAALGSPIEPGWIVTGSIHLDTTSGGNAEINFGVSGPKAKGKVHAVATIEEGKWKYETLTLTPDGGAPIDLTTPP